MGNYLLKPGVTLIARDDTWIDGDAVKQLYESASLPGMHSVAGMPDLHPGRGHPVGAAFFSTGRLYPALIGGDIGCGMSLWHTSLDVRRNTAEKLEKKLGSIDGALDSSWHALREQLAPPSTGFETALGTIGGGNHFAELQRVDEIYDHTALDAAGLDERRLLLLVHSGSRGLGQAILEGHMLSGIQNGLDIAGDLATHYLERHATALSFAYANRELIARRMLARLHCDGERLLDVHHNFVEQVQIHGLSGWLHRKGATPSDKGLVVIPGSRGDFSYLVEPVADVLSLFSLAHGAGRKWTRTECRDRLFRRFSPTQLSRTKLGSHVVCADRSLIYEEAPQAYKAVDTIIGVLEEAGLLKVLARLRPVLTYKTRGECCQ